MTHEIEAMTIRLRAQRELALLLVPAALLIGVAAGILMVHFGVLHAGAFLFAMLALFAGNGLMLVGVFRSMLRQRDIQLASLGMHD